MSHPGSRGPATHVARRAGPSRRHGSTAPASSSGHAAETRSDPPTAARTDEQRDGEEPRRYGAGRAAFPATPDRRRRSAPGAATRSAAGGRSPGQAGLAPGVEPALEHEASQLSSTLAASAAALPRVRAPERQWKITARPDGRRGPASSSFDSGRWRPPGMCSRACSSASRMSTRMAPSSMRRLASCGPMVRKVMSCSLLAPFSSCCGRGGRTA